MLGWKTREIQKEKQRKRKTKRKKGKQKQKKKIKNKKNERMRDDLCAWMVECLFCQVHAERASVGISTLSHKITVGARAQVQTLVTGTSQCAL